MATDLFDGSGNLGAPNWTVVTGAFNQSGGTCYGNAADASSLAVYTGGGALSNDHEATIVLTPRGSGQYIGPAVRCSSSEFTCAGIDCDSVDLYLSTFAAGVQTVLPGFPVASPAAGTSITLRASGTTLSYYYDGVLQGSFTPAGLPASGRYGIQSYSNGTGTGTPSWVGNELAPAAASLAAEQMQSMRRPMAQALRHF